MLQTSVVKVFGRGSNVDFAIDDTLPFEMVVNGLREYLIDNRLLLANGTITINAGLRMGSPEQLSELRRVIEQESGLTVARFWCSPDAVDQAGSGVQTRVQSQPSESPLSSRPAGPTGYNNDAAAFKTISELVGHSDELYAPMLEPLRFPSEVTLKPGGRTKPRQAETPDYLMRELEAEANPSESATPSEATNPSEMDAPGPDPEFRRLIDETASEPDATVEGPFEDIRDAAGTEQDSGNWEYRRDTALFVKSTCRSGEVIRHPGDVVILGDVNPGAEIIAGGDITVFGSLRGTAHAGSGGLTKAAIIAFCLESPRLQIGPYIGVAPNLTAAKGKRAKSGEAAPKIAYVRRRSIYVATFTGRFAKYSRGIPYEG